MIAATLATERVTLHELSTIYSVEDCYILLDIAMVDAHNQRAAQKHFTKDK